MFAAGADGRSDTAETPALSPAGIAAVQHPVPARVLCCFARADYLDQTDARDMAPPPSLPEPPPRCLGCPVLDLVGQMFGDFGGTAIEDQRSFLNDRVGTKLFGGNVTIHDDCTHPLQAGPSFDGEGVARRRLTLVDSGVVRDLAYSRGCAQRAGKQPTGHGLPLPNELGEFPINIVFAGGDTSIDDMIRSTEWGILVTRFWYIREVDPYEKIMTGMTRDGTFLIERGEVAGGIRNFRFNQGLIELLNHVAALGPAVRASGEETFDMVMPSMKAHDFHFTEVTRF